MKAAKLVCYLLFFMLMNIVVVKSTSAAEEAFEIAGTNKECLLLVYFVFFSVYFVFSLFSQLIFY